MLKAIASALFFAPALALAATGPIGRYESKGLGPVNSWWVETPRGGIVIFDAQRDTTSARAAIAAIRATRKPVRAILITHPHPDHVTGLALFKQACPNATVIAQAGRHGRRDALRHTETADF